MGGIAAGPFGGGEYIPDPVAQFLSVVVPWGTTTLPGFVNIHAIGGTGSKPWGGGGQAFASLDEYGQAQSFIGYLNHTGCNVYFCLSMQSRIDVVRGGRRRAAREAENAVQLRSFGLDLDTKKTAYGSQRAALAALLTFCDDLGLELGYVVSSGYGIHAYFTLDRPVTPDVWQPLASKLKNAGLAKGLLFDTSCTVNRAGLWRMPGTFNTKPTNPDGIKPVAILQSGVITTLENFSDSLAEFPADAATSGVSRAGHGSKTIPLSAATFPQRTPIRGPEADRVAQDLARGRVATDHLHLHAACPVFADSYDRGGDGDSEPLWYVLGKLCHYVEDGEDLFHDLSQDDPRYDPDITTAKYNGMDLLGWPSCATIAAASLEAARLCQGCAFNGQGKSPINFALYGLSGAGGQQVPPVSNQTQINGFIGGDPAAFAAPGASYTPIIMPDGYVFDSDNRIIRTEDRALVFDSPVFDLDLVSARVGTEKSFTFNIKMTVGRSIDNGGGDIPFEFEFSMAALVDQRALKTATFHRGLTSRDPKLALEFLMSWLLNIQRMRRTSSQDNMGWMEVPGNNYGGFTFGDAVFTPTGMTRNKIPKSLEEYYKPRGNLGSWKQAASHLVGKGNIALEVLIAGAFAAPLMVFTTEDGAIMLGRSNESGAGKTAALSVNQSVWGSRKNMLTITDTENSIFSRLGATRHLPVICDEMMSTTEATKKLIALVMMVTQGREKWRLDRTATEKVPRTWRTLVTAAANQSLQAAASGSETNAQAVRVLEFPVPNKLVGLDSSKISEIKDQLESNFGQAGMVYAKYLGEHGEQIKRWVGQAMDNLQHELRSGSEERFWLSISAAVCVGAHIAAQLKLLPFDVEGIAQFLKSTIRQQRLVVRDMGVNINDPMTHVGRLEEFLNENVRRQIITERTAQPGANRYTKYPVLNAETIDRSDYFVARIGKLDQRMLISRVRLRIWCDHKRYTAREMIKCLTDAGLCVEPTNKKSLGSGANLLTAPATERVLEFDLSKKELQGFIPP